jgi:hypothetical protein
MAIPTLGAMIAAIGSPPEWGAISGMYWDNVNGLLGIGKTPITYTLDVNGPIRAQGSSIFIQSDNTNRAYSYAPIQIREAQQGGSGSYLPPRLSFHWGGVVASQISIDSNGAIQILNNPGTGYEHLISGLHTCSGSRTMALDPVTGQLNITGDAGGWAMGMTAKGSSGTDLGGFWFYGSGNSLTHYGVGLYYNAPAAWFLTSGQCYNYQNLSHWDVTSDERAKKKITEYARGLKELIQLQPKEFEFNGKMGSIDGTKGYGLIAQDVEKIIPDAVHRRLGKLEENDEKEIEILGLSVGDHIHLMLVNSVKELDVRLKQLEETK